MNSQVKDTPLVSRWAKKTTSVNTAAASLGGKKSSTSNVSSYKKSNLNNENISSPNTSSHSLEIFDVPSSMSTTTTTLCEKNTAAADQRESKGSLLLKTSKLAIGTIKDVKAPNYGNDYCNAFVHQGILPQNWIRNIENPFSGYPKLEELHKLKQSHYLQHAKKPVGIQCQQDKIPETIQTMCKSGAQFDVVAINGCVDNFSFSYLKTLRIDLLTPRPSLLFLWCPSNKIAEARQLMEIWGFRRGEDISYLVNSLDSKHAPLVNPWKEQENMFTPTSWHCLMGLKGTLRRTSDTDLIHCNVDTDVIIQSDADPANIVPLQFYSIVENFTMMDRKIHIVPYHVPESLPVRPRHGWVMLGPDVYSVGEFEPAHYARRSLIPPKKEINILRPQTPPSQK